MHVTYFSWWVYSCLPAVLVSASDAPSLPISRRRISLSFSVDTFLAALAVCLDPAIASCSWASFCCMDFLAFHSIVPASFSTINSCLTNLVKHKKIYISHIIIRYSLKFSRIKYFAFFPNSTQKQISWIKFLWSRFQPCITCVCYKQFCGRKFSQSYSDPWNLRKFSTFIKS